MHPLAKVRHQIAERSRFPPFIQRFEAFGDAVRSGGDLVGIDGVKFSAEFCAWQLRVPENQRLPADLAGAERFCRGIYVRKVVGSNAGFQLCRANGLHLSACYGMGCPQSGSTMVMRAQNQRETTHARAASVLQSFCREGRAARPRIPV